MCVARCVCLCGQVYVCRQVCVRVVRYACVPSQLGPEKPASQMQVPRSHCPRLLQFVTAQISTEEQEDSVSHKTRGNHTVQQNEVLEDPCSLCALVARLAAKRSFGHFSLALRGNLAVCATDRSGNWGTAPSLGC